MWGDAMVAQRAKAPEYAMRKATEEIIRRAIMRGRKKGRTLYISKSANGKTTAVESLNPDTPEGKKKLDSYLTPIGRHYTISGLGAPEEKNAISWRSINLSLNRRILVATLVSISFLMKGTPLKNKIYRLMGVHIGQNVEIMQLAWLDHFRPDLIFIGDGTLIGAFSRLTVHAYEGAGKFGYGLIEIGANCTIGAGTGIGPIRIGDGVRTLPGTTLSPYLARIRPGSIVGYSPPPVRLPESKEPRVDATDASQD
jgi:acetyltransferase-like isoleucine patch superfamily enzyme